LTKVIIRWPFWLGGLPPCESVLSEQTRRELVIVVKKVFYLVKLYNFTS
jgi:hypothetical protein